MRIGVLTLPLHANYGGILQAYALQEVLKHMGHEVMVFDVDRDIHRSKFRQSFTLAKYLVQKNIFKKNVSYYNPQKINRERKEREQHTRAFIDRYINVNIIRNLKKDVPKSLDAIIVGSDQVWRFDYFTYSYGCEIEHAFLKFAEEWPIKRIAYAASFGTDEWNYSDDETKRCSTLLRKFDAVSVRELSGKSLCEGVLGYNYCKLVLDPTMLLSKEAYISLVENAHIPKNEGNLLCYMLNETQENQQLTKKIARERKLSPLFFNSKFENSKIPQKDRIQPPVELWLRGFMDAEFVVTDSFHGCVFSIIFGKPFVALGNKERGLSRFNSLMSVLSLEKNLISSLEEYDSYCSYEIPPHTRKLFDENYKESIAFLKESLI